MGGRKGVHVVVEATGGGTTVEITSIPGGFACKDFAFLSALEPDIPAVSAFFRNLLVLLGGL